MRAAPQSEAEFEARVSALEVRFPYLFRDRFWVQINRGWLPIVEDLIVDLDALLTEEERTTFTFLQIKAKIAGLRLYWQGGLAVVGERQLAIQARIDIAIQAAENACEWCGVGGEVRNLRGYHAVRCDRHARSIS